MLDEYIISVPTKAVKHLIEYVAELQLRLDISERCIHVLHQRLV
ncbi:hypothetical protein [Moraxella bovis]|nr:hypothetical protein [Moraxella bovis]